MEWRLFATLARTAGTEAVTIDDAGVDTVGEALDALLEHQPDLRDEVTDDGDLREHLRLLVDGSDPFREGDGLDTSVDHDAELALFPPVSGG